MLIGSPPSNDREMLIFLMLRAQIIARFGVMRDLNGSSGRCCPLTLLLLMVRARWMMTVVPSTRIV